MSTRLTASELQRIRRWFFEYTGPYLRSGGDSGRAAKLKLEHSCRVEEESAELAADLDMEAGEIRFAGMLGLLHDAGRFEQYRRHGTFSDRRSEDHGALGARVLAEHSVLADLPQRSRTIALRAVAYHNRAVLPGDEGEDCLLHSRLLRDGDKLDIYRVVTSYYHRPQEARDRTIELDLPDTHEVSEEVLEDLSCGNIVDASNVRTLNDFKLLQIGWVHDINYRPTLDRVARRRYLELIAAVLPRTPKVRLAVRGVIESRDRRLGRLKDA